MMQWRYSAPLRWPTGSATEAFLARRPVEAKLVTCLPFSVGHIHSQTVKGYEGHHHHGELVISLYESPCGLLGRV